MTYSNDTSKGQESWRKKLVQLQSKILSLKSQLPSIITKTKDDRTLEMIEHYQNMFIGFDTAIELFKRDVNSLSHFSGEKTDFYEMKNKKADQLESELLLAEEMIAGIGNSFRNSFAYALLQ